MKGLLVAILSLLPNYVFMEDLWHHADWPSGAAVASRGRGDGIDHHAHDIEVCISRFELIEMSYALCTTVKITDLFKYLYLDTFFGKYLKSVCI